MLDAFGRVGAHEKAEIGMRGDLGQSLRHREASEHVAHPHLAAAIDAEEDPRQVDELLREPEVIDVMDGERRHLVHEDVPYILAESRLRVEYVAPHSTDGAVFVIERLELATPSNQHFTLELTADLKGWRGRR